MTLPPGSAYPIPLQTLGWALRPGPWLERCRDRHGDMFTIRLAHQPPIVMLAGPDAIRDVFTAPPDVVHAGEGNQILAPILGRHSVLLLDGDEHMRQRRLLLPSFHGERMQRHGALMARVARQEIGTWPSGEPFALRPRMQAVTLEVIMRVVFGLREGPRLDALRTRLTEVLDILADPRRMALVAAIGPARAGRLKGFRALLGSVDELLFAEIRERRGEPDVAERDDVLSLLLEARDEAGAAMSDAELRDELMTLLVAGHETTATALAWALERLVRHPAKLARLRAGDEDYLDAVCKETLRLRPVIPIVARRLKAPLTVAGCELPAGVIAAPCIYLVHRRADVYPDPRAFRPERFLEQPAGTYTWIPFGGGVRRCLGASFALFEMKVVLRTLLAERRLQPARPEAERIRRRAIALVPEHDSEVVAA